MRKILYLLAVACVSIATLTSCHGVSPNAGEEAVLTYQPILPWSTEGVDMEPVKTGLTWCVFSTDAVIYKIIPEKHQVNIEDLMSTENTPLDAHTVIITKIKEGKSPILHKNYGVDWFDTNLFNYYSNRVRDYFSQYSPFDLMSNREILNEIDSKITKEMRDFVAELSKDKEFPIEIVQVTVGKAIPNKEQLDEMNRTAREVQAKQTEQRRTEAQKAREDAERQRARADRAYMLELGLNQEQLIQMRTLEMIEKKQGANIDVLIGDRTTSMWNVRR
jgi:regulator of protease activity HflC (stomatin/prohibitin superfamily)